VRRLRPVFVGAAVVGNSVSLDGVGEAAIRMALPDRRRTAPHRKQRQCIPAAVRRKTRVHARRPRSLGDRARPIRDRDGVAAPVARVWVTAGRPLQSVAMSTEQRTDHLSASPPLFESRFLDFFSRVHPSIPAIIFVPVVVIGVWAGLDRGYDVLQVAGLFLAGLLIWTFSEYWLHRTVFHWEPDHPLGSRLHFIMHGVHHEHPNDPLRLVMPPAVSIPLAALFFGLFALIFGTPAAYPLFSGFIAGYLTYDYTHFHLHHHVPKTAAGKQLREQHMRHHFQDHRYGYGVSSPLWDYVFRTRSQKLKPR
jgi:sterol desaturase/sphingolipid hydroxylase (fatty acid hydroxylase superfamily)